MKRYFRMSEAGASPFILTARALGYEPEKEKDYGFDREVLLKHAERCEALAAMQVADEGLEVIEGPKICPICMEKFHSERSGIHVEIEEEYFTLLGHLDRRVMVRTPSTPSIWEHVTTLPLEIKSLGVNSFKTFRDKGFKAFPEYACQEACYLQAEHSPGLYWVMNRDNGSALKMIVNDFNTEINLPGFEHIELPITYGAISLDHTIATMYIDSNQLPSECRASDEEPECKYCHYKYLCPHRTKSANTPNSASIPNTFVITPELLEARASYKEGIEYELRGKELKDNALDIFLSHAKATNTNKYYIEDMSFTYSGMKSRETFDKDAFVNNLPNIINILDVPKVVELLNSSNKKGKPFPSTYVKFAKDE